VIKDKEKPHSFVARIRIRLRGYLLRGLLVLVPLGVTAYVLYFCYSITAGYLVPIVRQYFFLVPAYAVAPISVVLFLSIIYLVGLVATVMVGRQLIAIAEGIIHRIPLVKTVYGASKQVVEMVSMQESGQEYQAAAIIDFPMPGMKALAFVTGKILIEGLGEFYKVFVPTTPNPTSGYFEIVPPERISQSDMTMDSTVKCLMSAGVLAPETIDISAPGVPLAARAMSPEELEEKKLAKPGKKKHSLATQAKQLVQKRLLSGFLVIVPLGVTVFVVRFIYGFTVGRMSPLVEKAFGQLPDYALPLSSLVVFLALLYVTGMIATAVVGRRFILLAETIIQKIPLVATIYGATKQMVATFSFQDKDGPKKSVVLIDFPYPGLRAIGFVTGKIDTPDGREFFKVFIPTSPNITVGLFELCAPENTYPCDLAVDDAVKMIVSGGIIAPESIRLLPQSNSMSNAAEKH
jgi:uncharacterized membrane protein